MGKKGLARLVYVGAAILMIIRVDWWWWGKDFKPWLGGWLTWPEVYQLLIFIAGYFLVWIVVRKIWEPDSES
jgi:hypothetical protein